MSSRDRAKRRPLWGAVLDVLLAVAFVWLCVEFFLPPSVREPVSAVRGDGRESQGDAGVMLAKKDREDGGEGSGGERPAGSWDRLTLEPGDILLGRRGMSVVPTMNPVKGWTHAALYAGNGEVIEAVRPGVGVVVKSLDSWKFPKMTWVSHVRVITAEEETRRKAAEFARGQVGQPYDMRLLSKQVDGDSWYCSELIWAAYMHASEGRIDLAADLDIFGVSPDDIFLHQNTAEVGGHFERCPDTLLSFVAKISLMCIILGAIPIRPFWMA